MISEFLISFILSLGISCIIILILRCIGCIIHESKLDKVDMSENNPTNSSIPGFNDEIIKLTNERINQEIQISNAIEMKAGIIIGSIGTFSAIFISVLFVNENFLKVYLDFFKQSFLFAIPFIIGSGFLVAAFVASQMVLIPRVKLKLTNPRRANNFLAGLNTIEEVKQEIKEQSIEFLEASIVGIRRDARVLRSSVISFGIGIAGILIGLVFPHVIPF